MSTTKGSTQEPVQPIKHQPITQRTLAQYLQLSPSTVSLVMNDTPRGRLIPEATRQRIIEAAAKFDYRPDFYAKYLSSKRSYTIAVILPEIRELYAATILAGIDSTLTKEKYLYFTASHHDDKTLIREYPRRFLERAAEGFLSINTTFPAQPGRPWIAIGNHAKVDGVPRFAIDNFRGGAMAVEHLYELGHRRLAVIKGPPWRRAATERWRGIQTAARERGLTLDERIIGELHSGNSPTEISAPQEGYLCAKELLGKGVRFTGLITFNDVTAIGAMRAIRDEGLRTPEDISVIGFDDIASAGYISPTLTTFMQPLEELGAMAAAHLLGHIEGREELTHEELVEPRLVRRESTRAIAPSEA
ncbi:transcriptional regulator, LacI family [Granulicella rosea]|uniref:Transcriptional regulator, LacI family n=1 Tax=Granulicella rosea TaxID=474952 RepID=A0A239MEW8_9BACT|nr:LacI family DNA-binding transcriptional regulator [Granulicella rosea]SNT41040.1 transcriptional regulator, LacI family [Granulicella rosea]